MLLYNNWSLVAISSLCLFFSKKGLCHSSSVLSDTDISGMNEGLNLQIILVVCRERLDWAENFATFQSDVLIYTKCGDLSETNLKHVNLNQTTIRRGPHSNGYNTKSLHTYVHDMIEKKQKFGEKLLRMDKSYIYMRPSLLREFTRIFKGRTHKIVDAQREKEIIIKQFFMNLQKISMNHSVMRGIGFMEFGDTGPRNFNCVDFKQHRFPQSVAKRWKMDGLPCTFRAFPRNQFLISSKFMSKISPDLLLEVREALDKTKKKPGSKKVGRNYFARKLEQLWDGLMGCGLSVGTSTNYCDNCGIQRKISGNGVEKLSAIFDASVIPCRGIIN